ncbi:MAG: lactate utilization protein C [Pseudomonadota bacterium]|nr:lactate utilization protein C [Pseudomonadota bacterium]
MTSSRGRAAVLGRVRQALGKPDTDSAALAEAQAYIDARARGPIPAFDGDRVQRFINRAGDMESTVARIGRRDDIPAAVASYLSALDLPPALVSQKSLRGVCWPEFEDLDWSKAGLSVEARPTVGDDRLGITGVYCAIAETGTLVFVSGAETPTATTLLPDTHVAVVSARRIVDTMEDAFALIRRECGHLPRAINLISGPSRTGDIEQTIVLGAHGPFRVHILVMEETGAAST